MDHDANVYSMWCPWQNKYGESGRSADTTGLEEVKIWHRQDTKIRYDRGEDGV